MKPVSFKSIRRPAVAWSCWLFVFAILAAPLAVLATDAIYISPASVNGIPPNVDATNFYNAGTWNIDTEISYSGSLISEPPFTTANTLNYTNIGTMNCVDGWKFDWEPSASGSPHWSANFLNDSVGKITASYSLDWYLSWKSGGTLIPPVDYVLVSATNIVNKGLLSADVLGEIILTGSSINLSRGLLQIAPIVAQGSTLDRTNYIPDSAIYDLFWSQTNTLTVNGSPWDGTFAGTYHGSVSEPCQLTNEVDIGFIPNVIDSYSNSVGLLIVTATNYTLLPGITDNYAGPFLTSSTIATNQYRQGVFVVVGTNGIQGKIHFTPDPNPTNLLQIVSVQFTMIDTNVIALQRETNFIYVVDSLTSSAARGLQRNEYINPAAVCSDPTFRPTNYIVARTDPGAFRAGVAGLGIPSSSFFYTNGLSDYFTNGPVLGSGTAYSAQIDNLGLPVSTVVSSGGNSARLDVAVTNLPGRIRIYADNLNLSQTKMRAEGQIMIQATNLTGSVNAAMDCQNLSYNLGSASGNLNVSGLAQPFVYRLHGPIQMADAVWTNFETFINTNNYILVTNVTTTATNITKTSMPLTNTATIKLYIMLLDASGLTNTVPVVVQDLILRSTNIVVSDSVNVSQSFLLAGTAFTLQGSVDFTYGILQNWTYLNAPTLLYFTNNGSLFIPNDAHFGDDRAVHYQAFVNKGTIIAGDQTINSAYLQIANGFDSSTSGGFYGIAQTAQVMNAIINAESDIQFFANNLGITNTTLSAGNALSFTVTNSLSDGVTGPANSFYCQNGFNLWIKPATGRLLNTTIYDIITGQAEADHYWAGTDLGKTTAGYTNNAAIGTLMLNPTGSQIPGYEPLFAFFGTTGNNGMYVSNLDLSMMTDFTNELYIDPSLTIYYVSVKLNPDVNTSGYPSAEAYLDNNPNLFGPRLQWMGVHSLIKTQSVLNQRFQLAAGYSAANGGIQLVGNILPAQTNIIEASTDFLKWVPIYTNIGSYSNAGSFIITDPAAGKYPHRFYRAVPAP